MAKFTCPGQECGRQFASNAALSAHKRACKDKIAAAAKVLLQKCLDKQLERAIAAKQQEEMEHDDAVEPEPEIVDVEPPIIVSIIFLNRLFLMIKLHKLARTNTTTAVWAIRTSPSSKTHASTIQR
jgi:hypothetical protein